MKNKFKYTVGIDEAGRGPLAGPLALAATAARANSKFQIPNSKLFKNIKDSKKLSAKNRKIWFEYFNSHPKFFCAVAFVSHKTIDKIGISKAVERGVKSVVKKLEKNAGVNPDNSFIFLDGSLKAPKEYKQKTIIRGDEKVPIISAASIIAKVARDKKMVRLHKKFPKYSFDRHKGYGTKLHYKKIKKHGFSPLHRRSFCKKIYNKVYLIIMVVRMRSTRAHTRNRRSHHALKTGQFSRCPKCQEPVLAHTVCLNCGTYKAREVVDVFKKLTKKERKEKEKELKKKAPEKSEE